MGETADLTLTRPRTYGVFDIGVSGGRGKRFRFGNHPVRQVELARHYGSCQLLHLFRNRTDAETVARHLNGVD